MKILVDLPEDAHDQLSLTIATAILEHASTRALGNIGVSPSREAAHAVARVLESWTDNGPRLPPSVGEKRFREVLAEHMTNLFLELDDLAKSHELQMKRADHDHDKGYSQGAANGIRYEIDRVRELLNELGVESVNPNPP